MLFNSLIFLLFCLVFFLAWPLFAPRKQSRWIYIIVMSFFFYGWWNWRYIFLLIGTGMVDFLAARAMESHPKYKRLFLVTSISCNLITLAAFKYLFFFTSNLQHLLHFFGANLGMAAISVPIVNLVLPVGISFYTFQSMSYTIDVYRGNLKATPSVLHFFASLAMFPHLVAGPIMRASVLLPQLETWNAPSDQKRWDGLKLIAGGYFKKVVLADNLAPAVNLAFGSNIHLESGAYWWLVLTMFAFQIYFDFNGYSDIARGLAKWMGYEFSLNFNNPYLATSFRDFWSRWHISLSSWFRDYVYIPLGGSKHGEANASRNLWITMLLSGFWHGANWTYVIWGALHAFYMQLERWTDWPGKLGRSRVGRIAVSTLLLAQIWIAWVFFRATSLQQAWRIVKTMFNPSEWNLAALHSIGNTPMLFLGAAVLTQLSAMRSKLVTDSPARIPIWEPVGVVLLLLCAIFLRGPGNAFIYFNF